MDKLFYFLLFKKLLCVVIKRDLQDSIRFTKELCHIEGSYYESTVCKCSNILNGSTLLSKNLAEPKCLGINTVTDEAECESFVYQKSLNVCPKASLTKVDVWEFNESTFRGTWTPTWNAFIKPMIFIGLKNNIEMNTTNVLWDGLLMRIWYTCPLFITNCILVKIQGERTYPLVQNYGNNILMTNYSAEAAKEAEEEKSNLGVLNALYNISVPSLNFSMETSFLKNEDQRFKTRKMIITYSLSFISILIVLSVVFLVRKNWQQKKSLDEEASKVNDEVNHYESTKNVETIIPEYKTLEPEYQVLDEDFALTEHTGESSEYSYAYGVQPSSSFQSECLQNDKGHDGAVEPTYSTVPSPPNQKP